MPYFLKVILIFGALFAVVPLFCLLILGSWKQAWHCTLDWLRVTGCLVLAALILLAVTYPFMLHYQ